MPWQFEAVDVATEYRVRDRVPYRKTVVITVPRQSGKSIVVGAVACEWMLAERNQYGILTAQTRIAATNRLGHIAKQLRESGLDPDHQYTRGVGNERIVFSNGSRLDVVSPTAKSVHGEAVDLAIIDEAWSVESVFMAGVVPAMVARPHSQLWVISTAGDERSELLNELVDRAREDPQGDIAFTEYSMPDDAQITDKARWHEWMPALGEGKPPRVTVASIAAAIDRLSLPEARRAFGNIAIMESNAAAIPWEWWAISSAAPRPEAGLSLAVDVNRTPPGWSIASSWPSTDGYHADLVEHGVGLELSQIPARMDQLIRQFRPASIGLDPAGPAGSLLPDFEALASRYGIELEIFGGRDRARADVHLFELLRDGRLTHSSMMVLDAAVEGARADQKGEVWFFSRPSSYVDISPLCAVSMAVWCAYRHEKLAPVVAIY
jgi:hypothetical protein